MMAFVTSATLAGAAGALYALNYSTVVARKFDFNTSIPYSCFCRFRPDGQYPRIHHRGNRFDRFA